MLLLSLAGCLAGHPGPRAAIGLSSQPRASCLADKPLPNIAIGLSKLVVRIIGLFTVR